MLHLSPLNGVHLDLFEELVGSDGILFPSGMHGFQHMPHVVQDCVRVLYMPLNQGVLVLAQVQPAVLT